MGAASVDPFDLLATPIGAECAGAVQFEPGRTARTDSGAARPAGHRADRPSTLEPIADADLAAALRDLSEGARFSGWRMDALATFSLAGTMPKLALRRLGGQWHWAAAEVERIARETPARLTAEIDELPTPLRASGAPTRLLNAITLRSQAILAG